MAKWFYTPDGVASLYQDDENIYSPNGVRQYYESGGWWHKIGEGPVFYIDEKWIYTKDGKPAYYTD